MRLFKLILTISLIFATDAQETRIIKTNRLLSRKRRYLNFPMGSNFVVSTAATKSLMVAQPRGWNLFHEIEVPFALPSDTRMLYKNYKQLHMVHRRSIYNNIEKAFSEAGFDGNACLKKILCGFHWWNYDKGKSLLNDLLVAVFLPKSDEVDSEFYSSCDSKALEDNCNFPELDLIIGALGD